MIEIKQIKKMKQGSLIAMIVHELIVKCYDLS